MKVRVVDYVASLGGGVRFTAEMVRILGDRGDLSFEVVSHAGRLERYRSLIDGGQIGFADIPPRNEWRMRTFFAGIPGAGPFNWILDTPDFHYDVDPRVFEGCDLVWFPWMHRHRIPLELANRVVASLHDTIVVEFEELFPPRWGPSERKTITRWLASGARIAVSSNATVSTLGRLFQSPPGRVSVIPLSAQHSRPEGRGARQPWPFASREYLLCPANTSRHKNHDVLLKGIGEIALRHPLVLTGEGSDLFADEVPRRQELRRLAEEASLVRDQTIFGLGYLEDPDYYEILDSAWALVMPTLAEGGGSFPVWEAIHEGIPAVCSDIPVMREMVERVNGKVIWFDPQSPASLAGALTDLERNYPAHKAAAVAQVERLNVRTWDEVAQDYARLMQLAAAQRGVK